MIGRKTPWTPDVGWEQGKYKKLLVHDEHQRLTSPTSSTTRCCSTRTARWRGPARVIITEGVTDWLALMQLGLPTVSPVTVRIRAADWERLILRAFVASKLSTSARTTNSPRPVSKARGNASSAACCIKLSRTNGPFTTTTIIGLMGMFDIDTILQESKNSIKVTYYDAVTGLMNRQGLLDAPCATRSSGSCMAAHTVSCCSAADPTSALPILTAKRCWAHCCARRPKGCASVPARIRRSRVRRSRCSRSSAIRIRAVVLRNWRGISPRSLKTSTASRVTRITLTILYGIACADEPGLSSENIYQDGS